MKSNPAVPSQLPRNRVVAAPVKAWARSRNVFCPLARPSSQSHDGAGAGSYGSRAVSRSEWNKKLSMNIRVVMRGSRVTGAFSAGTGPCECLNAVVRRRCTRSSLPFGSPSPSTLTTAIESAVKPAPSKGL